jgi:hypothetical protein
MPLGLAPTASASLVQPASVPTVPTTAAASVGAPGSAQATVTWAAPASGAPITGYRVTTYPGGAAQTVSGGTLSLLLTGLTLGASYFWTVEAQNAAGYGPVAPTGIVQPLGVTPAAVTAPQSSLQFSGNLPPAPLVDFGTDVSAFPSLTANWSTSGGPRMAAERFLRRITTPRGLLDFSPNDGMDVRDWLRDDMDAAGLYELKASIEGEGEKDEELSAVDVAVTLQRSTGTLTLDCSLTTAQGPFNLVVAVTSLSVDILNAGAV